MADGADIAEGAPRPTQAAVGRRVEGLAPHLLLGVGLAGALWLAVSLGLRVQGIALDETVIKESAIRYGSGLPGSLVHDDVARSTTRLYSLLLAPVFALSPTAHTGLAVARVLNAVLWVSAALPAWLIARRVLASGWLVALAALGTVWVPWMALTNALYTEDLAYPLVLWVLWAALRAVRTPGLAADALVVALLALAVVTRTQLVMLLGGWLVAIAVAGRVPGAGVGARLAGTARRFGVTAVLVAVVALAVVVLAATQGLHDRVHALLSGGYTELQGRRGLSQDVGAAVLTEAVALGIGLGVLPLAGAVAFLRAALPGGEDSGRLGERRRFARVALAFGGVLAVGTAFVQGGDLGPATEERYYVYLVPLLVIAGLAALEDERVRPRALAAGAVGLGLLAALTGLPTAPSADRTFLAPVDVVVGQELRDRLPTTGVLSLSPSDGLLVACLGLAAVAWAATRRRGRPAPRAVAVLVGLPVAVQVGLTLLAFHALDGGLAGVPGRTGSTGAAASWIDRALSGSARAALVLNTPSDPSGAGVAAGQRTALFDNDRLRSVVAVAGSGLPAPTFPLSALASATVALGPGDRLRGLPAGRALAQDPTSPVLQVAGRRLAGSPDGGLELVAPGRAPRARWRQTGVGAAGGLAAGVLVRFGTDGPARVALRLRALGPAPVRVVLGLRRGVAVGPGGTAVAVSSCDTGRLRPVGGPVLLESVVVRASPAACAR